jgi:hypothetical protein
MGAPHFLHEVVLHGLTQLSVPHFPHRIFSSAISIILPFVGGSYAQDPESEQH